MFDLPCVSNGVINVIICSCTRGRCVPPCKCASQKPSLQYTEMFGCGTDNEHCNNLLRHDDLVNIDEQDDNISSDESDSDDDEEVLMTVESFRKIDQ